MEMSFVFDRLFLPLLASPYIFSFGPVADNKETHSSNRSPVTTKQYQDHNVTTSDNISENIRKILTLSRLFQMRPSFEFIWKYKFMNIHALIDLCLVCEWICALFSLFNHCDQSHKDPLAFPFGDYEDDYDEDDHPGTTKGKIHLPVITLMMIEWCTRAAEIF